MDVDETLPRAALPGRVLNELFAHAREAHPEECCGLVLGDDRERFDRALRCRNDMTRRHATDPIEYPRDGRSAFYVDPRDQILAERTAEKEGQRITAVYHSHVDHHESEGIYLSDMDLDYAEHEFFPWPGAAHIVISVCEGRVTGVGLFERDAEGGGFSGRRVGVPGS